MNIKPSGRLHAPLAKRKPRTAAGMEETYPGCDYTDAEIEFMMAMDRFRSKTRRRYPTCRDILGVMHELGYRRVGQAMPDEPNPSGTA